MPPRKEPKEQVIYPSSKRKVPAFKPLRPSKVPRIPTTESESSVKSTAATGTKKATKTTSGKVIARIELSDSEGDEVRDSESEDDDDDGPTSSKAKTVTKRDLARQKTTTREDSPMSVSSEHRNDPPDSVGAGAPPMLTQSDDIPGIPQPLLLRLLHESFADKNTKIDKHAIQVFQKYIEVFVREAIARAQLEKRQAAERGEVSEMEAGWLDLEDLEKVAAGLMLDF
ncbi:hypothetical protein AC579_5730 [Lecanosticta acicola]|uniref:Centromere protein X n=1 Tax=Lecanosticta acicola TaxID=111012 RepID=A0AAI8Z283_9PEZI|nr:hypothetical protein AC579_5730 [Lecanosticta acicola]